MVDLVSITVNWLLISALYTLVAIGFTLIFGVGAVLNLAHGAMITLGAFAAYFTYRLGFGIWLGLMAAILIPGLLGIAMYRWLIRPVQERPIIVMLTTFLVALIIEEIFLKGMGSESRSIPRLFVGHINFLGQSASLNRIAVFVISWAAILGIIAFINWTWTGKAIKAISMNDKGAAIVGVEGTTINLYTWFIASALAGIAGVFLGSYQTAHYAMGLNPLIISFAIVVLGGLGSVKGTVIAAYLVGLLEVVTTSVISPNLSGLTPLLLFIVVILIRPEGFYGHAFTEEA